MAKAAANIASLSPLHNLPPAQLADQLGAIKADLAALEIREKTLRDELLRRGVTEAEGALFSATISQSIRWTIKASAVKAEMGAPWWDARTVVRGRWNPRGPRGQGHRRADGGKSQSDLRHQAGYDRRRDRNARAGA
jgi:hypothetical protein